MARRLRTKLSRALRSTSTSCSATLALHPRSGFSSVERPPPPQVCGRGPPPDDMPGRRGPPPKRGLGFGAAIRPSRIAVLRACLRARRTASAFTSLALGGFLVGFALFHLPEDALALHLLFSAP